MHNLAAGCEDNRVDMGIDLSAKQIIGQKKKKRKMPRRYLISLSNCDLQFVIILKWSTKEFRVFVNF